MIPDIKITDEDVARAFHHAQQRAFTSFHQHNVDVCDYLNQRVLAKQKARWRRVGALIQTLAFTGLVVCGIAAVTVEPAAALVLPIMFVLGLVGYGMGE